MLHSTCIQHALGVLVEQSLGRWTFDQAVSGSIASQGAITLPSQLSLPSIRGR